MIPIFRSRFGLWCIRLSIAVPALLFLGFVVFEAGNCTLGLTNPGTCQYIPDEVGNLALVAGVFGIYGFMFATPLMLAGGLIAEWFARRR